MNSRLNESVSPALDSTQIHPCAGCDTPTTLAQALRAGFAVGQHGQLARLCSGCFGHVQTSPEFLALVVGAVSIGYTLPSVRRSFEAEGMPLPVTPQENQHASEVLRGLDAMDAMRPTGPLQ